MITRRLYKSVAANTTETDTYTVPTGKELEIRESHADAGASPDTVVVMVIDDGGASEEIILATHNASATNYNPPIIVASGLTLKIKLVNDQNVADHIGGFWVGTLN